MKPDFRFIFERIYEALKSNRNVEAYEQIKRLEEDLERNVTYAIKIEKKGKKKK